MAIALRALHWRSPSWQPVLGGRPEIVVVGISGHTWRTMPTIVLIHGAGETGAAWRRVQDALVTPSVAIDLLGRGSNPSDLSLNTLERVGARAAEDIESTTIGPVILVAHSISGAVTPGLASQLGARVQSVVHLAAVCAPPDVLPLSTVSQDFVDQLLPTADVLRSKLRGHSFSTTDDVLPEGLLPLSESGTLARLDSIALGCVGSTFDWKQSDLPRTYVRTTRDRLYSQDGQRRLAEAFDAHEVIELDSGHNPQHTMPDTLASVLDDLVEKGS
jgi:pimeloyl-ACP methyl ester carboxylesterase